MVADGRKIICITGCTRGLGRAMAEGFAARGHVVAGCARSAEAVAELAGRLPAPHLFSALDVADDAAVAGFAGDVVGLLGAPHLLLNNAAIMNRNAPLWEVPAAEFSEVVDVNIKGLANTIRHFVPAMIAAGRGLVVNFSSGWGRSTSPEVARYCATKFAVEGLTAALAQELPPGVGAVSLNPGIIDTDMLRISFGGSASAYPSADEWASAAVPFLDGLDASDSGAALTAP